MHTNAIHIPHQNGKLIETIRASYRACLLLQRTEAKTIDLS